jgi:hypothetical protein
MRSGEIAALAPAFAFAFLVVIPAGDLRFCRGNYT